MNTLKLLITLAIVGTLHVSAADKKDHKGSKECNECCKSAEKCDACCHDKGKGVECKACCFEKK